MLTRRRLLPLILLLLLLTGCGQRVTTQQSATVYVHGSAAPGTLVHIYYPTGSETDAKAGPSGYWGQTVTRQNGTFTLTAPGACIVSGPAGANVSLCRATFKLPVGDTFGDFVVESVQTPTPTSAPTATATPPPTASGSRLYICNDAAMVEVVVVGERTTVLVSCNEAGE